ncbi:DUF1554 domain-containing protein [Leptospira ellisii]|uniref:DUF1554 domain-containing protein n=1 Tax=Leptospira ellisii TaxID=2023197 RepID=A0A2N0BGD3_9LEPT|nr:DUF1554 domain-containing protein [Leptospira ellisii]MDV6235604.1 DUF1554 domain-containing protein [Leptospira ellisii]PJZ94797.1 hypothetical protein CH379_00900 [Leptospira ellisii]PKA03061.1 hypothetical protein CH375_19230 [Leptospira ellisii]
MGLRKVFIKYIVFYLGLTGLLLSSGAACNRAERISLDASKGNGLLLNVVPSILNSSSGPFDATLIPTTLNEGDSIPVIFTLTAAPSSSETFQFAWENPIPGNPGLSPTSAVFSSSNTSATITLQPIDDNCLEDTMTLKATRSSDGEVFRFTFTVNEADKCTFVTAPFYTGNFNGLSFADQGCAAEKPASLPGNPSEYKAMISGSTTVSSVVYTRQATLVSNCNMGSTPSCTSTTDWVLRADTRYYRADGTTLIFRTHPDVPAFDFSSLTMDNSMDGSSAKVWTGIASDWLSSGTSCIATFGSWTYASGNATYGNANATNSTALAGGTQPCNLTASFFCVRQ